jgi:hypothetical protein
VYLGVLVSCSGAVPVGVSADGSVSEDRADRQAAANVVLPPPTQGPQAALEAATAGRRSRTVTRNGTTTSAATAGDSTSKQRPYDGHGCAI